LRLHLDAVAPCRETLITMVLMVKVGSGVEREAELGSAAGSDHEQDQRAVRDCPFGEIEALHHTSPIRPWISIEWRMSFSENRSPLFRDMRY
jgi:hypothetical protein